MAHQTPLAAWLYSKRSELNPLFHEFSWPAQVFPGVFDFETKISWGSVEAIGRGVDLHREIALEKAVSEAIERLICQSLGFNSVGFAVAGTHDPSTHAKHEALERYYLNRHLEKGISLVRVEPKPLTLGAWDSFSKNSSAVFYRMRTIRGLFGIVCRLSSKDDEAVSFGFALSESLENGVQRSLFEALPSFAWLVSGEDLSEHAMPWHIDRNFVSELDSLLTQDEEFVSDADDLPNLRQSPVSVSEISVLADAPLKAARFIVEGEK